MNGARQCGGRGEGAEEAVERGGEEQGEQGVGDEDAGEEEDSGGGEYAEAGVEGGAFAEGLARPAEAEQHKQQHGERLREMRGEGVAAEDAEAGGGDPVGKRGLLKIADVVDAEGDPVAGEGHLAGGVGVGAVGVVQHRRGEEGGEEEGEPESTEEAEGAGALDCSDGAGELAGSGERSGSWNLLALTAYVVGCCGWICS